MPRRNRCILPDVPCHITQRGVDRCEVFSSDLDRITYLRLLQENLSDAAVRILGYCLMSNHVHLVAIPAKEESLSILFRRLHGRYAQYYNARVGRSGHLWQNRFFACMLGPTHLWAALAYVERNPVRAGMVEKPADYPWSSASAHLTFTDQTGILDMEWWKKEKPGNWEDLLRSDGEQESALRNCTYAGKPFGAETFVTAMAEKFGRYWDRGRPTEETSEQSHGIARRCKAPILAVPKINHSVQAVPFYPRPKNGSTWCRGRDIYVEYGLGGVTSQNRVDGTANGPIEDGPIPTQIVLGHELIHALHDQEGTDTDAVGTHQFVTDGTAYEEQWGVEEFRTTGYAPFVRHGDITEN